MTTATAMPSIVSRSEWDAARADLMEQEKAVTKARDRVNAARRRMPMVQIGTPYVFQSANGPVTLRDLFGRHTQLIVQHFMFGEDWDAGCPSCSHLADNVPPLVFFHDLGVEYARISRAPVAKLQAYNARMGWEPQWVSSGGTTFNDDFGVTIDGEEIPAISVFLRDGDDVYHTYSTTGRGTEPILTLDNYMDMTPYGRQETWEDSPPGWPQLPAHHAIRRRDEYDHD